MPCMRPSAATLALRICSGTGGRAKELSAPLRLLRFVGAFPGDRCFSKSGVLLRNPHLPVKLFLPDCDLPLDVAVSGEVRSPLQPGLCAVPNSARSRKLHCLIRVRSPLHQRGSITVRRVKYALRIERPLHATL